MKIIIISLIALISSCSSHKEKKVEVQDEQVVTEEVYFSVYILKKGRVLCHLSDVDESFDIQKRIHKKYDATYKSLSECQDSPEYLEAQMESDDMKAKHDSKLRREQRQ